MANNIQKHDCLEHLDASCSCTVCNSSNHFVVSDDDGSGMGRVNEACLRCGKTAAFNCDTGYVHYDEMKGTGENFTGEKTSKEKVVRKLLSGHDCKKYVEADGTCLLCGKRHYYLAKGADQIRYAVKRDGTDYLISGIVCMGEAKEDSACRLAVTVVPFIASGKNQGKFVVYDTLPLKRVTGSPDCMTPAYDMLQMFCIADPSAPDLIGEPVPQYVCNIFAWRVIRDKIEQRVTGMHYDDSKILPVGFATNTGHGGNVVNYIFAMPMEESQITSTLPFVAIEHYVDKNHGMKRSVALRLQMHSQMELRSLFESSSVQVSETISELWLPENETVYGKLLDIIESYGG